MYFTNLFRTRNGSLILMCVSLLLLILIGNQTDDHYEQIPMNNWPNEINHIDIIKTTPNEVYGVSTDGIETAPNEVYGVSTDGIETTPNEVYGVSTDGIETTPNMVYGVSTDGIETTPNVVYGVRTERK